MISKANEFYSYLFQEEEGITAAYFQTNAGTGYRVYFYPISAYFDILSPETQLYQHGYFFGFTKLAPNEGRKEAIDLRVRNTIINAVQTFIEEKGANKVLIFYYDDEDGSKLKRFICFDWWYQRTEAKTLLLKIDEEIITIDDSGLKMDTEYISLLLNRNNSMMDSLLIEFQLLKEQLIANK
jgi:hypothetical protein